MVRRAGLRLLVLLPLLRLPAPDDVGAGCGDVNEEATGYKFIFNWR